MESAKMNSIKEQVEYYLSDQNLSRDQFFHGMLNENGHITIEALLNCNKIKQLSATKEQIIESLKSSEEVEFVDQVDFNIKRKKTTPLPELSIPQKKVKKEQDQAFKKDQPQQKQLEPIFLAIKASKEITEGWKTIEDLIKKEFNYKPYYIRFNRTELSGHCAFNKNEYTEEQLQKLIDNGFKHEEAQISFSKMNEEEEKEFWNQHGYHYNVCMSKKGLQKNKGHDKDKKKQQVEKKETLQGEVIFGNKKFSDINKLSQYFKELMNKTANDEIIEESASQMLTELLKFHENTKKSENVKNYTVGVHPEYKNSRCFFVIKTDDTKEDFSLVKCLKRFEEEQIKLKKKE